MTAENAVAPQLQLHSPTQLGALLSLASPLSLLQAPYLEKPAPYIASLQLAKKEKGGWSPRLPAELQPQRTHGAVPVAGVGA